MIDTPGMREIQLWVADEGLEEAFEDVTELFGRCRFSDCGHESEPGCAVKAALADGSLAPERWESYLKLQRGDRAPRAAPRQARRGRGAQALEGALGVRPRGREGEGPAARRYRRRPSGAYDRPVAAVSEIMARDVLGVAPETSLLDAARRMHERRVGAVVVLDGERLVGILTERDVLRAVATDRVDGPVSESMTHSPGHDRRRRAGGPRGGAR